MTDLEITRLCAQASDIMLSDFMRAGKYTMFKPGNPAYDPLHDDAQAMRLVKKLLLDIHCRLDRNGWYVGDLKDMVPHSDLNHAICLLVAKMQMAKGAPERP